MQAECNTPIPSTELRRGPSIRRWFGSASLIPPQILSELSTGNWLSTDRIEGQRQWNLSRSCYPFCPIRWMDSLLLTCNAIGSSLVDLFSTSMTPRTRRTLRNLMALDPLDFLVCCDNIQNFAHAGAGVNFIMTLHHFSNYLWVFCRGRTGPLGITLECTSVEFEENKKEIIPSDFLWHVVYQGGNHSFLWRKLGKAPRHGRHVEVDVACMLSFVK